MKRRDFLKHIIATGSMSPLARMIGSGAGLGSLGLLSSSNAFAAAPSFSDYKAMVVVNLYGGNDAFNMFVPTGSAYSSYQATRSSIAVENTNLMSDTSKFLSDNDCPAISIASGTGNPYYDRKSNYAADKYEADIDSMYRKGSYHTSSNGLGINGLMPEFAELYRTGKLSIISNNGTLVKPTTKAQIDDDTAELPFFLFAHNHQQRAVETAQAETMAATGWAGRIADAWGVNAPIGLNISYSGVKRMLIGENTSPLTMGTGTPTAYKTKGGPNGEKIEDLLTRFADSTSSGNLFERYAVNNNKTASELSTLLSSAWINATDVSALGSNPYGESLFTVPESSMLGFSSSHEALNGDIFQQLEATAKMIKLGQSNLGFKRQVFYVQLGGFDSHSGQAEDHSMNLRSLSLALSDFYKSLEAMGLDENVMTFSTSDFGRTLQSNGDGTDHGWGGHSFMLCGDPSFQGGNTFGTLMSDYSLTSDDAYTNKGRIIPTTSIEQMLAPALNWFGVDNALITSVLPNINNFKTGSDLESAFMQGVFA